MSEESPHAGFRELIRRAKAGEDETVWEELLEAVLSVLQQQAKEVQERHGTDFADLITETWLAVSGRIDRFALYADDDTTFAAFVDWMAGIMEEVAGTLEPPAADPTLGRVRDYRPPPMLDVEELEAEEPEESPKQATRGGAVFQYQATDAQGDDLRDVIEPTEIDPEEPPSKPKPVVRETAPWETPEPEPLRDDVHFAIYSPPRVRPAEEFLLTVWAFLEKQREEMQRRAHRGGEHAEAGGRGPVPIERGSELQVLVTLGDLEVEPTVDTLYWNGEVATTAFVARVPEGAEPGRQTGMVRVLCHGWQIAQVRFEINVGQDSADVAELPADEHRIRSVFASYARKDLREVMPWVRGAELAGIDVFFDVLSLRAGDNWSEELKHQIPAHDLFCLFWSEAAAASPWVEKEWRCALEHRGCDYIHPVPLVDPAFVPPPPELADCLHFDDVTRIVMEYQPPSPRDAAAWTLWVLAGAVLLLVLNLAMLWWLVL